MLNTLIGLLLLTTLNTIELPYTNTSFNIDGYMNEQEWENSYLIDTTWTTINPDFGKEFEDSCKINLMYDNNALYVFFTVYQDTSYLVLQNNLRDQFVNSDYIGILIDPMNNRQEEYIILINLPNGIVDFRKLKGTFGSDDALWNSNTEYSVKLTEYGYNVEMKIPFSDFRRKEGNIIWNINFVRNNEHTHTNACLFPLEELTNDAEFVSLRSFQFNNIISERERVEVMPYSFYGKYIDSIDIKNAGFDIRIPVKTSSVINFAFNPDFSQLEGDPLSIDFNSRYAIYYREYRPFFTEEKGVFSTSSKIFYSRAIQNPYLAGRYTYKDKYNQLGIIIANDEYDSLLNNTNSLNSIIRYNRQMENFSAGFFIVNNYNQDNDSNNIVLAADGNFNFGKSSSIQYTGALSSQFIINNDSIYDYDNYYYSLGYSYIIQDFVFSIYSNGLNDGFNNNLGYIIETNRILNSLYISKTFRLDNEILNKFELSGLINISDNWDNIENISISQDSLSQTEYYTNTKCGFTLFNTTFIGLFYTISQTYYNSTFLNSYVPKMFIMSRPSKYFSFSIFGQYGGSIDYFYTRSGISKFISFDLELNPFDFLSIENELSYNNFSTDTNQIITNSTELDDLNTIWNTLSYSSSLTLTPNNTYSINFIFERTDITFTESYYPSYYYINDIPGDISDTQYKIFSILEYKPSLDNIVYIGAKYTFCNTNQLRNEEKEKIIFFKFTHKFYL